MAVSACGILPRVAQQTTAAAIAPVANTARVVSSDLRVISQNLARSSASIEQSTRRVSLQAAQTRAAINAARARSEQITRIAERSAALSAQRNAASGAAPAAGQPAEQVPFDVLPATVLARLTPDQAALQRAAQKEAFTAPIGEVIFWEDGGRTGTASAEDEKPMGSFLCRTFVQTVVFDDAEGENGSESEEKSEVLACRNPGGVWEASFGRSEFGP